MKTLTLLASLAVIAAASSAELKDPASVARDWNQTIEQAREPVALPQSLLEHSTTKFTAPAPPFDFRPDTPPAPRSRLKPPGRLFDDPHNRVPPALPGHLPPGAKPWEYNGQTYWLVPISPEAGM